MKITLNCPHAEYISGMRINCKKIKNLCPHVYFKACKGWWALTPQADRCPVKEDETWNG
jgi:hypothetical protein